METLPTIRVDFTITGEKFDLDRLTETLGLCPSRSKTKNEWPEIIVESQDGRYNYCCTNMLWEFSTERRRCKEVRFMFEEMMSHLQGKEFWINEFCKENKLTASFNVSITMNNPYRPDIFLTKEVVDFIHALEADVGFDLYID